VIQSNFRLAFLGLLLLCSSVQADHILPAIEHGDIAVRLQPVATGMAAPDYAISPPGDTSRLFVVEQNGLLRVLQNDILLPGAALNIQSRVQQAPVGTGPMNAGNPNDERGFLGLDALHLLGRGSARRHVAHLWSPEWRGSELQDGRC
jgi:hypothetical protein